MREQIPQLLDISDEPTSELIDQVRDSDVSEDLVLPYVVIEAIAGKLHFYQQMEADLPEWRKARKASTDELAVASAAAMNAVTAIRDNILRTDNASVYHQDAIEGYARMWKKQTGEYPASHKAPVNQKDTPFTAGVRGLTELGAALQFVAAACDVYSDAPSKRLPEFGKKGPIRTEGLKSWLVFSLADLLTPYTEASKDDYIRDLIYIIGIDLSRKRVQNILSQG